MTGPAYSLSQKLAHWLTVVLILALATTGMLYFWEIGGDGMILRHQIIGQTLIVVLIWRIILRMRRPRVGHPNHAAWERVLAQAVHLALYLALGVAIVTGYVAASGNTENALALPVSLGFARSDLGERFLLTHYQMKWVLLGLIGLHVMGALKHHFLDRDSTLRNIWFGQSKDKN